MTTTITKRIEFDAGHRVPDHASKCRSPHGHRYAVIAEVSGLVVDEPGNPENGMVKDFGFIKDLLTRHVHDPWDHAFLVADSDRLMCQQLNVGRGPNDEAPWKVVRLAVVPTAENLAALIFQVLTPEVACHGATLEAITVWETPTCSATYRL